MMTKRAEAIAATVPCVEWTRARSSFGHGSRWDPARKTNRGAHVMAWEEANGPVPPGLWVLHHCDNPPCIEPRHLYLGTATDNAQDRERRGRRNIDGARNGRTKLTDAEVEDIRRLRGQGFTLAVIARWFGVGTSQVHRITQKGTTTWLSQCH